MNDIYFSERKKEGWNENRRKFLSNRLDFQSINVESGRSIHTTRYHSDLSRSEQLGDRIPVESNGSGSCITRNDGKDGDFANEWNRKEGREIPAVWKWELPGSGMKLKRG